MALKKNKTVLWNFYSHLWVRPLPGKWCQNHHVWIQDVACPSAQRPHQQECFWESHLPLWEMWFSFPLSNLFLSAPPGFYLLSLVIAHQGLAFYVRSSFSLCNLTEFPPSPPGDRKPQGGPAVSLPRCCDHPFLPYQSWRSEGTRRFRHCPSQNEQKGHQCPCPHPCLHCGHQRIVQRGYVHQRTLQIWHEGHPGKCSWRFQDRHHHRL